MIEPVVNVVVLTLLFTVAVGGTLLIRSTLTRGRERIICAVWTAVLLLSVVPIYSSHAAVLDLSPILSRAVAAQSNDERLDVVYATEKFGYVTLSDVERDCERVRKIYGGTLVPVEFNTGDTSRADMITPERLDALSSLFYLLGAIWLSGAFITFIKPFSDFYAVANILALNSGECRDPRILAIFNECRAMQKIKRRVPLRIAREGCLCSPCVAGIFRPYVYIGSDCAFYGDNALRFIFAHELSHIRRRDLLFKLFSLSVCAVHWFNPLSRIVPKLINEDCELACDAEVLKLFGREQSESYMFTILDIAESIYRPVRRNVFNSALAEYSQGGMFISGGQGRCFLQKRYANMKLTKTKRFAALFSSLFILTVFVLNAIIISSCGIVSFAAETDGCGNIFLDTAVRGYYGLTMDMEITPEMLDGITSFSIRRNGLNDIGDKFNTIADSTFVYVDFIVNGRTVSALPLLENKERMEEMFAEIKAFYTEDDYSFASVNAFYKLFDPFDPRLNEENAKFLLDTIKTPLSSAEDESGLYVFDYYASEREINMIASIFERAGLMEHHKLLNGIFDASCLDVFPNLQSVSYEGVTPVNESERTKSLSVTLPYISSNLIDGYSKRLKAITNIFNGGNLNVNANSTAQ